MAICSVIIRCYNEEQHIGRVLTGVMEQTVKDVEIIVVDSGSTDATLSIASRYPVKVLSIRKEDFSFGRSLNIGCAAAQGEFLVLISAHVYPIYRDWLERILAPFDDENVALVYGKQRAGEGAQYSEHQVYKKWYPDHSAGPQKHPFCNNANAAVRRSLWEILPYNEDLTGLEDLDWANRAIEKGYKIVYCAAAETVHIHNESYLQTYNRYRREAIAFKNIFPHERFHIWHFLKLFLSNTATDYCHARHDKVLLENLLSIPIFRFLQFWGAYCGFSQRGLLSAQLRNRFYYPPDLNREQPAGGSQSEQERRINYEHH